MSRMLPVLFMRRRSLLGPIIGRHSGVSGVGMPLSKSVGQFIAGDQDIPLSALIGWTGLESCGTLLDYDMTVGNNGNTVIGASIGGGYGNLNGATINGLLVYRISVDTVLDAVALAMVDGVTQIPGVDTVVLTFQSFGEITLTWNGGSNLYTRTAADTESTAFTAYLSSLDGQGTSYDNYLLPIQAQFDGTTALRRAIISNTDANEITVSLWVWRNTGIINRKMYDIGDGTTSGNETTRLRFNGSGNVDSLLSSTIDGGANWTNAAVINTAQVIPENEMHHIYMTAKNDLVDGTAIMQLWYDGAFLGQDTSFTPNNSTQFNFIAGDFVTLCARHNLSQFLVGRIAEIWSSGKFMDAAVHVPLFRHPESVTGWASGYPRNLGVNGIVNGVTPSNYLGGDSRTYTLTDWNNGVNRGSLGDFGIVGNPIT